jgi:hypothetical protein
MVNLLISRDKDMLKKNHIIRLVYDPCCGSGGMLTIAKEHILSITPAEAYTHSRNGLTPSSPPEIIETYSLYDKIN